MECLVTKLKGTVNDNSLLPLGGMFFKVVKNSDAQANQRALIFVTTKDTELSVVGGADNFVSSDMVSNPKDTINVKAHEGVNTYCKDGDYNILLKDKYSLLELGSWVTPLCTVGFKLEDLSYSKALRCISANIISGNVEGDLSALAGLPLRYVSIGNKVTGDIKVINDIVWSENTEVGGGMPATFQVYSKNKEIVGKISELKTNTLLTALGFNGQTGISGSLSEIAAKFPNLTTLNIPHTNITGSIKDITCPLTSMGVYDSPMSGSLEEFVATQRIHGRTTGTCTNGGYWTGNITFNGKPLGNEDAGSFSWTASQITCGETTITA